MRPVKVVIIGAGNVLWAYLQALDRLIPRGIAQLGPVCARRRENWPHLQTRRPGIELVADPLQVLQADVDVALIITPPESHSELVRTSLEHGKHVVVEKPAASTRCEAQQLAQLAPIGLESRPAALGVEVVLIPEPMFLLRWPRQMKMRKLARLRRIRFRLDHD